MTVSVKSQGGSDRVKVSIRNNNLHNFGLSLLYSVPRRVISLPVIMKLAANKNVGLMMVVQILSGTRLDLFRGMIHRGTYCIMNGVSTKGALLDQTLPLHPTISPTPPVTNVGSSHHMGL